MNLLPAVCHELRPQGERWRLGALLALATVPFLLVLVLAYYWVLRPLDDELRLLSRDIETRFEGVARLQVALARAAMPVNDYLINGRVSERRQFQWQAGRVEAAFALLRGTIENEHRQEIEHVAALYERWHRVSRQGEALLALDERARRENAAASAMKEFDATLDDIVDATDNLLAHVREELARARDALALRRERLTWFVVLALFLATMVTLVTVLALSQRLTRPDAP